MAFSGTGAVGGTLTGAQLGSVIPGIGTLIGAGAGGILGGLFGGGKKTSVQDLRTPQQKAADDFLAQLMGTGSAGGINLGQAYTGSLGDFNQTGQEQQGQALLSKMLGGAQNQDINQARGVYSDLANQTFNPSDPSNGFSAFSRQVARATGGANDVLNREAAITGTRYGTGIQKQKKDLAAQQSDSLQTALANIFQNTQQQRLQGAQGLTNIAGQESDQNNQLLNQAATFGDLQRQLNNQQAQAQYSEFNRQRGEQLSRIDLAKQVSDNYPHMGTNSIPGQSPFSGLINSALSNIGYNAGSNNTNSTPSWLSSLFNRQSSGIGNQFTFGSGGAAPSGSLNYLGSYGNIARTGGIF